MNRGCQNENSGDDTRVEQKWAEVRNSDLNNLVVHSAFHSRNVFVGLVSAEVMPLPFALARLLTSLSSSRTRSPRFRHLFCDRCRAFLLTYCSTSCADSARARVLVRITNDHAAVALVREINWALLGNLSATRRHISHRLSHSARSHTWRRHHALNSLYKRRSFPIAATCAILTFIITSGTLFSRVSRVLIGDSNDGRRQSTMCVCDARLHKTRVRVALIARDQRWPL